MGKFQNNPSWLKILFRWATRAVLMFIAGWTIAIAILAWWYVEQLFHPGCESTITNPPNAFQTVQIKLPDGAELAGWWHAPANGTAVVILGGHGSSRDTLMPEAQMLASHGYGVLTIDYRQCIGRSATLGIHEVEELEASVAFASGQTGVERIAAMGFSAGGVAVIRGAQELPEVRAVIAMGNYANLYEEIMQSPVFPFGSLGWQIQQAVAVVIWLRTGVWPGDVSPVDVVATIQPRPLLFIYGEEEVESVRGYEQFARAGDPKQLWVVPGVGHGGYYMAFPDEFEQRVLWLLESIQP